MSAASDVAAAAVPVQYSAALRTVMTDDDCGAGAEVADLRVTRWGQCSR